MKREREMLGAPKKLTFAPNFESAFLDKGCEEWRRGRLVGLGPKA